MRRRMAMLAVVPLLLAPTLAAAQEQSRAAELEARQQARVQGLGRGPVACGPWSSYGFDGYGTGAAALPGLLPKPTWRCPPPGAFRPDPHGYRPHPPAYGSSPHAYGYGAYGYGAYGYGAYGYDAYGYGAYGYDAYRRRAWSLPNPYRDWAGLWGRGWLDGDVPPYHRFQYRFFPETLPDPTRGGYVTPDAWVGPVRPDAWALPPGRACARIELLLPEGPEEVRVPLPALGATTPEALRAVITDRLGRGAAVTLRDVAGYVVRFPAPEQIRELSVGACPAR